MPQVKTSLVPVASAALMLASFDSDDDSGITTPNQTRTYHATVQNLTRGQPFSTGILVTHSPQVTVGEAGSAPSPLIVKIAEDGFPPAELIDQVLGGEPGIDQIVQFHEPMMPIGANLARLDGPPTFDTFQITASGSATRLSAATMIICTNDGFTGVNSVELPTGDDPLVFLTEAYDAGSEQNTEAWGDIVDGCQMAGPVRPPADGNRDDGIPEDGNIIAVHPGVFGVAGSGGLVPFEHGWNNPVGRITIRDPA